MARRSAHRRVFDPMDILGTRRARKVRWAKVVLLALAGHAAREVEGGFSPWCTADDIPGGVGSLWQTPFCGWVKTELYCLLAEIAARPEYYDRYLEELMPWYCDPGSCWLMSARSGSRSRSRSR